jgi:prepilin-type N-terminal cleavage/methylation domain-containing protein
VNRRRLAAFTLIEVLIALAIMSLVMVALYTILDVTLRARDQIEIQSRVARLGPSILDLVEADLRRIWLPNIAEDKVFLGESRTIDGEPADSLCFLTNVDSSVTRRVGEREISSDVCETGYRLRRNPDLPDVMELWRRQTFHVDEEPLKDGVYELLHDRVVRFQVRYLDEIDPLVEELHDWDTAVLHRLPAAVKIELALEAVPRSLGEDSKAAAASRTLVYNRVIPLADRSELVMRAHPIPPTFVAAGGTDGANDATGGMGGPGGGPGGPGGPGMPGGPLNTGKPGGDHGPGDGGGGGMDPGDIFGAPGSGADGAGADGQDFEDFLKKILSGG